MAEIPGRHAKDNNRFRVKYPDVLGGHALMDFGLSEEGFLIASLDTEDVARTAAHALNVFTNPEKSVRDQFDAFSNVDPLITRRLLVHIAQITSELPRRSA